MSPRVMHACMLEPKPKPPCTRPLSACQWLRYWRACILPCAWHHASQQFFSEKGLQMERERQMFGGYKVIHPFSPFSYYWDLLIFIVYGFSLLNLPLQVFRSCPHPYNPLILIADATNFLKIVYSFYTGIVGDGKYVKLERPKIAKSYIKDIFFVDLITALPLQLLVNDKTCRLPKHTTLYIFKLFRIITCSRIWRSIAKQHELTYMWSFLLLLMGRAVLFFHWMTYFHYQVPVFFSQIYAHDERMKSWMVRDKVVDVDGRDTWPVDSYVTNLYLVTGLWIGAGFYGVAEMKEQLPAELLVTACLSLFGLFFVSYIMITCLRLLMYQNHESYVYHGQIKELHEYFKYKNIPRRLVQKIQLFLNYRFNGHYYNKNSILNTLNVQIKQEINMISCKKLVGNVPLFQDLPIALINTVIFSLTQVLYMPGEIVVRCGHPGSSLYLIASGTVAVMDAQGSEVGHMKDGAYFGEAALLRPGTLRTATIIALEITEIYKLNNYQFVAALQPWPRLKRRLLPPPTTQH